MNLAKVRLQEGESIDNALRRFKCKVQTEDIIKEVKRPLSRVDRARADWGE
jgi:ribosomal protein S21